MKKIVFVGGLARAGKTTTLRRLENLGFEVYSTSRYLDDICEKELGAGWSGTFANKLAYHDRQLEIETGKTIRDYKIDKAEVQIVPTLGRYEGLIVPTLTPLLTNTNTLIAIESIGGEEYRLMRQFLQQLEYQFVNLNCYTLMSTPIRDIRTLLPAPYLSYSPFSDDLDNTYLRKTVLNFKNYRLAPLEKKF